MSVVKSIFVGLLVGLFLASIFAFGFFLRDFLDVSYGNIFVPADASQEYGLLLEAQSIIDQVYLREQPDKTTRQYAAIRGVLDVLNDRNTFFIEPPVARSESQVLAGVYGGIGVAVQRSEDGRVILYPFDDSPALRAGVNQGDVLVAVNREPILATDNQDSIDQKMRGEVKDGNGVLLTLLADDIERELFIAFDVIRIPSIMWRMVTPDIGYIHIMRFTNRTPSELAEAFASLTQEASLSGLVLDLRNNSGGLLEEAIQVAGFFLDAGVVTYEVNKTSERPYNTKTQGTVTDLPLVVLVNQRTASASELVAGAIQDRNRGILIGQVTYGKGTVQQIYSLSDGSSIHVTSAEWLTPNRNALDGVGLQPNIAMIPDPSGRDVELGEAIRYLQQAGRYECKNCQSPF